MASSATMAEQGEAQVIEWLHNRYRDTSSVEVGSSPKKVKFANIHEEFKSSTARSVSDATLSRALAKAFPRATTKRMGKRRHTFVLGIHPTATTLEHPGPEGGDKDSDAEEEMEDEPVTVQGLQDENHQLRHSNLELRERVQALESQIKTLEHERSLPTELGRQMYMVSCHGTCTVNGPDTPEHFTNFSLDAITTELQTHAPDLYRLFMELGDVRRTSQDDDDSITVQMTKATTSLCTLLNARSLRVKGFQLLMGLMLIARATSRQVITVLNHAGISMSHQTTWRYLRQLTTEARYLDVIREGHWQWVYDNINMHQKVRHEREDKHSSMLNATARLAVRIQNLPPWEVNWADTQPQRSRVTLTINDILPTEEDATAVRDHAVLYLMQFLTQEFKSLHKLAPLVPTQKSPHPVQKTQVAPMKIVFKDEKYKADTIDILSRLREDAGLTGTPQAVVGDQLTCKNIRGGKRWRLSEVDVIDRLSWAHEIPGDFHFVWECLRVVYNMFWGTPSQAGSLCNLRETVRRTQVDKDVKVFNVGDEFVVHVFKAHLAARICQVLKLQSTDDPIEYVTTLQWLQEKAESLVEETLYPTKSDDPVYSLHRTLLHTTFLYIDLRNAIRWEDGAHIIRHWKLWMPRFVGTGCKNYANEAVNLLTNIVADFPRHIAYIAVHNRTVNVHGKPGRAKPLDQLMEHYILVLKQALRSSGSNTTDKHIEDISLGALFLMEAAKKANHEFSVTHTSGHTTRDAEKDVTKMTAHLIEKAVSIATPQRQSSPFVDLTDIGWKKISTGWLQSVLDRSSDEDLHEKGDTATEDREVDLDYELCDVL